jgi:hypothetical protein
VVVVVSSSKASSEGDIAKMYSNKKAIGREQNNGLLKFFLSKSKAITGLSILTITSLRYSSGIAQKKDRLNFNRKQRKGNLIWNQPDT